MPRFTLSQLLMGTALVAIVLLFIKSEGCAARFVMIESLSFSADDSRLLVTKLTAYDARTPMKLYKSNLERRIFWMDVATGRSNDLIKRDFQGGNQGPAFNFWRVGRTSALSDPSNDQIVTSAFGGGNVTLKVATDDALTVKLSSPACNIGYSPSGRFLAASGMDWLSVIETRSGKIVMEMPADDVPFLFGSLVAFSADDSRIAVCGWTGVRVYDIPSAKQISKIMNGPEPLVNAMVMAPDDTLIICSDAGVQRFMLDGELVATLSSTNAECCAMARDGSVLAVSDFNQVQLYDLSTNELLSSLPYPSVTALSFSSTGDELAFGNFGCVTLIETATGRQYWTRSPFEQYRLPLVMPVVSLVVWLLFARRMFRRSSTSEEAPENNKISS